MANPRALVRLFVDKNSWTVLSPTAILRKWDLDSCTDVLKLDLNDRYFLLLGGVSSLNFPLNFQEFFSDFRLKSQQNIA